MPKPKVLATRPLFPAARTILDATCDVEYFPPGQTMSREDLLRRVKDKEGLVCLLTDKVNEELLRNAPKLRIVSNVAVGFDNIDVAACTKRGVIATNTPGVLDETTADFAWTLMMAVARRIGRGRGAGAVREMGRDGIWISWWARMCGARLWGLWDLGGSGGRWRGGRAGFQMKVLYTNAVRVAEGCEKELNAEYRDLNSLLAESDFVTVHVPLNSETRAVNERAEVFADEADGDSDQYFARGSSG